MTAASISSAVISKLTELDIDVTLIRGQGYDGASTMSGSVNGVQMEIKKHSPSASYVHCASHVLSLVTQKASAVTVIRNARGQVKETANFFNYCAKRTTCLQTKVQSKSHVQRLKNVSYTLGGGPFSCNPVCCVNHASNGST